MPRSSEEMERDLEVIDRMAEELDRLGQVTTAEDSPPPSFGPPTEAGPAEIQEDPTDKAPGQQDSLLPAVGKLLENLFGVIELLVDGVQAAVAKAGIGDNAEQLGPLSLVLGTLKKARDQAGQFLGKKNE